jgi:hypothetical protein
MLHSEKFHNSYHKIIVDDGNNNNFEIRKRIHILKKIKNDSFCQSRN